MPTVVFTRHLKTAPWTGMKQHWRKDAESCTTGPPPAELPATSWLGPVSERGFCQRDAIFFPLLHYLFKLEVNALCL